MQRRRTYSPNQRLLGNCRERFERQLKDQLKTAIPRAGTLGLIAGARALQKTNQGARAAGMLRRSRDPIARLELYLIERQSDRASADASLRQFAASVPPDDWPAPLLRAFLGKARDDEVTAAATDDDERCEANYYLGRLHAPTEPALARKELAIAVADECDQSEFALFLLLLMLFDRCGVMLMGQLHFLLVFTRAKESLEDVWALG